MQDDEIALEYVATLGSESATALHTEDVFIRNQGDGGPPSDDAANAHNAILESYNLERYRVHVRLPPVVRLMLERSRSLFHPSRLIPSRQVMPERLAL
jgi:hypothetical protein